MHENARSAVECGSLLFRSGQLAGRGRVCRAFGERDREQARGIKAAASCRTPQRLRRLTPVFSIEASPILMAARNLLLLFFSQKQIPRSAALHSEGHVILIRMRERNLLLLFFTTKQIPLPPRRDRDDIVGVFHQPARLAPMHVQSMEQVR